MRYQLNVEHVMIRMRLKKMTNFARKLTNRGCRIVTGKAG